MKSLYEKICDETRFQEIWDYSEEFKSAVVIKADNVAEYWHELEWKPDKDYLDSFPNIAPPFKNYYIEHQAYSGKGDEIIGRLGIHVQAFERDEVAFDGPEDVRWICVTYLFSELNGVIRYPKANVQYTVTKEGKLFAAGLQDHITKKKLEMQPGLLLAMTTTWLTTTFLHCKNVELVEKGPPVVHGKHRRGGEPKIKYYTLEIEPMKKVLRTEGCSEKTGLKMALHICRGHFKTFDQHGLFGKYQGTYWWADHLRGSKEHGEVIKDYAVNAPLPEGGPT